MKSYIVTLKDDALPKDMEALISSLTSQGTSFLTLKLVHLKMTKNPQEAFWDRCTRRCSKDSPSNFPLAY